MIPEADVFRLIVIISKYGWHGTRHLSAMLQADAEERKHREYIATVLWSIGRIAGGEAYPFPEYSEYMNLKPKDKRTAENIVSGLIDKLQEGGKHDA